MRLLQKHLDDGDLIFTKDLVNDIPPYAILSHTWGDDEEELTHKDVVKGRGREKPGYAKVQFCLEQAAADGLEHVWVDTCCIDKANSTELQQAINSMYVWYRNATKCYVYLSDVTADKLSLDDWQPAFQKTRWATRGWTLQELLAPQSVEFFSSEGCRLGDKTSLEPLLHKMTGISIRALRGAPPCEFTELERMSWIEHRHTKHQEDMAYALLGLFDVHMPLIYGEGHRNAFNRLRETIALRSGGSRDTSAPSKAHTVMPFGRNTDFVGREDILEELIKKVTPTADEHTCQMTVIEGLGGVGKTQIALEAAYRIRHLSRDCSVFWVPAVDKMTIDNAYRKIGQSLQIPEINDDKAKVKSLVKDELSRDEIGSWLLIIDNADDPDIVFGKEDIRDYLPISQQGSILFTTRHHEVTVDLDVGRDHVLVVEKMDEDEALQLLQKRLTETQTRDTDSARRLLEFLMFLPLAIRQASAYMSRTGISTSTYLGHCESSDATEIHVLSQHFEDRSRYRINKSANPIATTWLISFRHVEDRHPVASRYLKFLCCLAEKDIPISLLPQNGDDFERDMAIGVLKNYAFISAQDETDSLDIHRLVRLAVCNWMKQENDDQIIKEVIQHLSNVYPDPSGDNKDGWLRYLPHADAALDTWTTHHPDDSAWSLLVKAGQSHFILGRARPAEKRYRQASEFCEKGLGLEHAYTIASMSGLSTALRQQARYPEAEELQRRILQSSIRVLGLEHPYTLAITNSLAEVLRQSGRYLPAEEEQQLTLSRCSAVLGHTHPSALASMNNLAIIHYQKGNHKQAELLCRELLQRKIDCLGETHVDLAATMNSLAIILDQTGRYREAEEQHRRTLQLSRETFGDEHAETMASVTNLAGVLYRQGRYREAEEQHRLALRTITKELDNDHPDALANTNGLAEALRQQGDYREAEQLHRRTLQGVTKTLGLDHPSTLMVKTNLAATLLQSGNCQGAEDMFRESLIGKARILGPEHLSTVASHKGLATVFMYRKKYQQAETLYQTVLELRTRLLGAEHPLTSTSKMDLAVARHFSQRGDKSNEGLLHVDRSA